MNLSPEGSPATGTASGAYNTGSTSVVPKSSLTWLPNFLCSALTTQQPLLSTTSDILCPTSPVPGQ